ncbi:MAG TPA: hypothetical protein VMF89_28545 [Polyangiales bacterium]|nr:hypothetical protein [Polyangiales bacterium]
MSSSASDQSFVFDRPLDTRAELTDRDQQLAALAEAFSQRRSTFVEGLPRHGKTSVVNVALADFASSERHAALRIDCSGVLTVADLVRRVEDAYAAAWATGAIEEALIERLDAVSFQVAGADAENTERRLQTLLELMVDVASAHDGRAVVALDNVHDVIAVPKIADAVRAARQRGGDRVSWVFTGPRAFEGEQGLRTRGSRMVEVGALDPAMFADEVIRRFEATGRDAGETAQVIASVGAGHPQRSSLLAAQLWALTPEGGRATVAMARAAIDNALIRCSPEFEIGWNALHRNERRVAVAIANGIAPQGTRAQRATGLASVSAAQRALQGVRNSGVASVEGDPTALTDPLFAEWLRRRYPQAPPEPGWQALRRAGLERGLGHRGITR